MDDHNLFREGLAELLASVPGFNVIAQGSSGVDAITLAHTHRPDVLLLDVELPGPPAAATVRRLRETDEQLKVVVLTMHDDLELLLELIEAGADGYLLKTAGRSELIAAVTAAQRNEDTIVISVSRNTVLRARPRHNEESTLLSSRELEVLHCLQSGGSNRKIGADLHISEATVKRHLANIFAKLGASSRLDAVHKASLANLL